MLEQRISVKLNLDKTLRLRELSFIGQIKCNHPLTKKDKVVDRFLPLLSCMIAATLFFPSGHSPRFLVVGHAWLKVMDVHSMNNNVARTQKVDARPVANLDICSSSIYNLVGSDKQWFLNKQTQLDTKTEIESPRLGWITLLCSPHKEPLLDACRLIMQLNSPWCSAQYQGFQIQIHLPKLTSVFLVNRARVMSHLKWKINGGES